MQLLELESERVMLRRAQEDDWNFFIELMNDEDWIRNIGDRNMKTKEAALKYINETEAFVVVKKETTTPIGIVGLWKRDFLPYKDLGFALLKKERGQGFAEESCNLVLRNTFEPILLAFTKQDNEKCVRLLERLKFHETPQIKDGCIVFEWEKEREEHECMSRVLEGLYLSDEESATDEVLLRENNIDCVLTVGRECVPPDGIKSMKIEVDDWEMERLDVHFETCCEFIRKNRVEKKKNVLVHCGAGVSRSATVVIAYMMKVEGMTLEEAFHFVKERRSCIVPNEGFTAQLIEFERQLFEGVNTMKLDDFEFPESD